MSVIFEAVMMADLHIDNNLPYAKRDPTLVSDRLHDTMAALTAMHEYAEVNDVTNFWILGDLLNRRLLDAVTAKFTMRKIKMIAGSGITIRCIPGNHEAHDASARHYTLEMLEEIDGVYVYPHTVKCRMWNPDGKVFIVPFKPDAEVNELLKKFDPGEAKETILLMHQTVIGATIGKWAAPEGLEVDHLEKFRRVFAGHFHSPQDIGSNGMYLGAPIQHNFGDGGETRGFWHLKVYNDGTITSEFVPLLAPMFYTAEFDLKDGWKVPLPKNWASGLIREQDYTQIIVNGTSAELGKGLPSEVAKMKVGLEDLGVRLVKVRLNPKVETKKRLEVKVTADGKFSLPDALTGYVDGCDLTGLSRKTLVDLGLRAIKGGV